MYSLFLIFFLNIGSFSALFNELAPRPIHSINCNGTLSDVCLSPSQGLLPLSEYGISHLASPWLVGCSAVGQLHCE